MRMLHLILPRRIPSRRRLVNIMKGDFLASDRVQNDGPDLLVVPREAQVHPMMSPVTVASTKRQTIGRGPHGDPPRPLPTPHILHVGHLKARGMGSIFHLSFGDATEITPLLPRAAIAI
jgi:hypothetical protein